MLNLVFEEKKLLVKEYKPQTFENPRIYFENALRKHSAVDISA